MGGHVGAGAVGRRGRGQLGGCRVWWRGFLANRAALIEELGPRAEASWSDEMLVAAAYRRWGATVQAHLLGEYALVVLGSGSGCAGADP